MSDPLEPVRKLQENLVKCTESMGLRLTSFAVLPGQPDHVQAVFEIDADKAGLGDEEKLIEDQIAKLKAEIAADDRKRREENALAELKGMYGKDGTFLGDSGG